MFDAAVAERRDVGGGLVSVVLDAPPDVLATYKRPGQYVAVETIAPASASAQGSPPVSSPSYFVLACPVGAARPELLLRGGGDVADLLAFAPLGTKFRISATQGAGFPCDAARGRPLIVAVAGTGIAAARSVVAWRLDDGDAARTEVYVGIRKLADLAVQGDVLAWKAEGVDVTLAISREDPPETAPLPAFRGYVQDAIKTSPRDRTGALLFAIGPDAMITALRELAKAIGVGERDLHTNY